jgi:hypothetical protein
MIGGYGEVARFLMRPEHRLPCETVEYMRGIIAGARSGQLDIIRLMVQESGKGLMDHNSQLAHVLMYEACRHGRAEELEHLLDNGM